MAADLVQIVGVDKLSKNLHLMSAKKRKAFIRGLKKAGLRLQRASQLIVPVDTGALKNSAFTRLLGTDLNPIVIVGYTASYAIYVHENKEARHAAGKKAKFLEDPARELQSELRKIIAIEVRKG